AAPDLPRHRNPRIQVTTGASARDDDSWRHASGFAIAIVTTCGDDACCDTLRRIAMPSRLMSSDEPPALTKGSGMPLVGARPVTTLILRSAWNAIMAVSPTDTSAPKRSGARLAVRSPRHVIKQKHTSTVV